MHSKKRFHVDLSGYVSVKLTNAEAAAVVHRLVDELSDEDARKLGVANTMAQINKLLSRLDDTIRESNVKPQTLSLEALSRERSRLFSHLFQLIRSMRYAPEEVKRKAYQTFKMYKGLSRLTLIAQSETTTALIENPSSTTALLPDGAPGPVA